MVVEEDLRLLTPVPVLKVQPNVCHVADVVRPRGEDPKLLRPIYLITFQVLNPQFRCGHGTLNFG